DLEGGRLPGPVGPEEAQDRASGDREGHLVERPVLLIAGGHQGAQAGAEPGGLALGPERLAETPDGYDLGAWGQLADHLLLLVDAGGGKRKAPSPEGAF